MLGFVHHELTPDAYVGSKVTKHIHGIRILFNPISDPLLLEMRLKSESSGFPAKSLRIFHDDRRSGTCFEIRARSLDLGRDPTSSSEGGPELSLTEIMLNAVEADDVCGGGPPGRRHRHDSL